MSPRQPETPLSPQMQGRRERILSAARDIIAESGYDALTMRALASASRVTVPTIYNLIGSKDAVLFAAVEETTARFVAAVESSRGGSPAAQAMAVVEATVKEMLRLPRYYRTLLMLLFTSEGAAETRREVNRAMHDQFAAAIEALDAVGHLATWVDRETLAARLAGHVAMAGLQWAAGRLSAEAFRAVALFDTSTLLMAVTQDASHRELQRVAARAQRRGAGRSPRRKAGTRRAEAARS